MSYCIRMSLKSMNEASKKYVEIVRCLALIYKGGHDTSDLPPLDWDNEEVIGLYKKRVIEHHQIPQFVVDDLEEEGISFQPGFDKHTLAYIGGFLPSINEHGEALGHIFMTSSLGHEWEDPSIDQLIDFLIRDPTATFDLSDELLKKNEELKEVWKKCEEFYQKPENTHFIQ